HAVQAPEHRGLAASGRPDEARDLSPLDGHVAVAHGEELAVVHLFQLAVEDDVRRCRRAVPVRGHCVVGHRCTSYRRWTQARRCPRSRLATLMTSTIITRTSDAAHASSIWFSKGMPEKL